MIRRLKETVGEFAEGVILMSETSIGVSHIDSVGWVERKRNPTQHLILEKLGFVPQPNLLLDRFLALDIKEASIEV